MVVSRRAAFLITGTEYFKCVQLCFMAVVINASRGLCLICFVALTFTKFCLICTVYTKPNYNIISPNIVSSHSRTVVSVKAVSIFFRLCLDQN